MKRTILTVLGALALFGCGGGGGGNGGRTSTEAKVAYVNASPDAPSLDFSRNGSVAKSAVAYGTATAFESAGATDADFSVRETGGVENLWSEANTFADGTSNLVVAVGLRTPPVDDTTTPPIPETIKRLVLSFGGVDRTAPNGGNARLILVNGLVRKAGFPTPPVDFRDLATPNLVAVNNLAFGAITSQDVAAGTQSFEVRQTGTSQVFVASTSLALQSGKVYLALVSGLEGATDPALAPQIRLIPL